jgi:uncharacterized membrane protein YesL
VSRADDRLQYRVPDAPSLPGSVRATLSDFYFNSWRLVPANGLWGIGLLAVILVAMTFPLAALPLAVLLAVPAAGVFRLATLIVRDEPVAFSDALAAWRRFLVPALLTGAVLVAINFVLGYNIVIGLLNPEPVLWIIATLSVWAVVVSWAVTLPFWVLLTDPLRESEPLRGRLRLAGLLVLMSPLRFGVLLLLVAVLLVVSTILFAALLTIAIAFVALLSAHYTLPAADRLEQRETQVLSD